jgi:prolipoprotein diacylglyceryltransferase
MLAHPPSWLHGFFVLLATGAATVLFLLDSRRRGRLDDRLVAVVLGTLIGGALAARVSTLWRYVTLTADPTLLGALLRGGQSVLGGLAGAYLGAVLTKRLIGMREDTGDLFAPAVALGIGIGRFGCLLTEPPGTPTGLSFGVTISAQQAARFPTFPAAWAAVPLHPSFAYEIVFHLAAFVVLRRLRRRPALEGSLFKLYLLSYALFRFAVEFVRGNPAVWAGLSFSQLFLIPSSLCLAWALRRLLIPTHPVTLQEVTDG